MLLVSSVHSLNVLQAWSVGKRGFQALSTIQYFIKELLTVSSLISHTLLNSASTVMYRVVHKSLDKYCQNKYTFF